MIATDELAVSSSSLGQRKADVAKPSMSALNQIVHEAVTAYLEHLGGEQPNKLFKMVMREVEIPLIKKVLLHTGNNQSLAARLLGISRGTLRKKIEEYQLA